jgi:hypothetical protein
MRIPGIRKRAEQSGPPTVRIAMLGSPGTGKTNVPPAITRSQVEGRFPSGGRFGGPPQITVPNLVNTRIIERTASTGVIGPTIAEEEHVFEYMSGANKMCVRIIDTIGHVLNMPPLRSGEELQKRFKDLILTLKTADVFWLINRCPPPDQNLSHMKEDAIINFSFVNEALRDRETSQPVSVAVVVSKCDQRFRSQQEIRSPQNRQILGWMANETRAALGGLPGIGDLAVWPISSFGFGNAVFRPASTGAASEKLDRQGTSERLEIESMLKGPQMEPFNVIPLLLWSMLAGAKYRRVNNKSNGRHVEGGSGDHIPAEARVLQAIQKDFGSLNGLYVPLQEA